MSWDWLGRTSSKWPILCWVGRKTFSLLRCLLHLWRVSFCSLAAWSASIVVNCCLAVLIDALDQWCLRTLLGIKWHQCVPSEEVRRITKQPNLAAIIQSRRLCIFGHIACMDDDADAKMILMVPPPENWKRPPGRPRITWLNTVQWAYNLTLNEAVDVAQNRPLWRLMSTYGTMQS